VREEIKVDILLFEGFDELDALAPFEMEYERHGRR